MRADCAEQLPVTRSERSELRLDPVGNESGRILHKMHRFHVQLFGNDGGEFLSHRLSLDKHLRKRLADLHVRFVSGRPAERYEAKDPCHVPLEIRIDPRSVGNGIIAEVHRQRSVLIDRTDNVLIDLLRHERRKRCGKARHRLKHGIQRHIGCDLVGRFFASPVTIPAAAHIPV